MRKPPDINPGELGVQALINAVPEMNNIARVDGGEQVAKYW